MGRLPGGDQRAVRHRQEGPPRPRPGQRRRSTASASPTSSRPTSTGPGDKFHPTVSHVIPALIKKCVEAVEAGDDKVEVWGTGTGQPRVPLRRRRRRGDRARRRARTTGTEPINLGTDHEVTIRETVETIARLVGFDGELRWDPTKPDGQPRRRVDASRAEQLLGWRAQMPFEEGLRRTIDWYLANRDEAERAPTDGADRGAGAASARTVSRRRRSGRARCRWRARSGAGRSRRGLGRGVPPGAGGTAEPSALVARRAPRSSPRPRQGLTAEERQQRGRLLLVHAQDGGVAHVVRVGREREGGDLGRAQRGQAVGQRGEVERGVRVHGLERRLHEGRDGQRVAVDGGEGLAAARRMKSCWRLMRPKSEDWSSRHLPLISCAKWRERT